MALIISEAVEDKLLKKHGVSRADILECVRNRKGRFLLDDREEHATDPPTQWFVSTTDACRALKIVFMFYEKSGDIVIKTAYGPNATELEIYKESFPGAI